MKMPDVNAEFARMGVATVYEASGRQGLVDIPLTQVIQGSRAAGPALPVMCGQDDNLMAHAVIEQIQPGDVIVLTMPNPAPYALIGDLLASQMKLKLAAAVVVDGAIRDCQDLIDIGFPVWARYVSVRGASNTRSGTIGEPAPLGGTTVRRGDILVLDRDGAVVVAKERQDEVLERARARLAKETSMRHKFDAGETTFDLLGMRGTVERPE